MSSVHSFPSSSKLILTASMKAALSTSVVAPVADLKLDRDGLAALKFDFTPNWQRRGFEIVKITRFERWDLWRVPQLSDLGVRWVSLRSRKSRSF